LEQFINSRELIVDGRRLSSEKDSKVSKSSLTLKCFRELSCDKPHSSLEAINLGHLSILRLHRLEGNCHPKNDSSHGLSYNTRELRLVNKYSAKGNEEECQPVIVRVRREL
jgi:hypothetical protein